MPHSQKLTELKEFKWALWGPLGTAAIVAIVITMADYLSPESLHFCLTSECINDAINRHKLSLGIAALVFPLVALVASNHRSIQTAAQIQTIEQKNSFENHVKHKDLFKLNIEKATENNDFKEINTEKLYKSIFTNNNSNNFEPYIDHDRRNFLVKLEFCFYEMAKSQLNINYENYLIFINSYIEIEETISVFFSINKIKYYNVIYDLDFIKQRIELIYDLYNEACLIAYSKNVSVEYNSKNVTFIKEIDNFLGLAFKEDGGFSGVDEWGEKGVAFGKLFQEKLYKEYNERELNLKYLDKYLINKVEL